jgi:hypothetical protein
MDKLWNRTKRVGDCLEWQGCKNPGGYGLIQPKGRKLMGTHRLAYELTNGPIPDGMCVMHMCDKRDCIEPKHLKLGTYKDNSDDMVQKGRSAKGDRVNTSKLTANQVLEIRRIHKTGLSNRKLAKLFGVGESSIRLIIHRKSWIHI